MLVEVDRVALVLDGLAAEVGFAVHDLLGELLVDAEEVDKGDG